MFDCVLSGDDSYVNCSSVSHRCGFVHAGEGDALQDVAVRLFLPVDCVLLLWRQWHMIC